MNKSLKLDPSSLENSNTTTNLEKINVNNDLSSCSLYAIDITTEWVKLLVKLFLILSIIIYLGS